MNKLFLPLAGLLTVFAAGPASAQHAPDLVRFEWTGGFFSVGQLAEADFSLDTSGFGGQVVERSDGILDVDPSLWYGFRGSYRLSDAVSVGLSYMHSQGRYRVRFPALASVSGDFDLEGLILAGQDFAFANSGTVAESAMGKALSDLYLATLRYEFRAVNGWAFPFLTIGGGRYLQKSDGNVIQLTFDGEVPENIQSTENLGLDPLASSGLSSFAIDDSDWAVSFGGGIRVALSERWGADVELEDIVRLGSDLSYIDASSTPPPDLTTGRLWSTTFRGTEGSIHNLGIRVALNYSLWPYGSPR